MDKYIDVHITSTVVKDSQRCPMCRTMIFERNWAIKVTMVGCDPIIVHDNEGICIAKFLVAAKIIEPNFLSTRPVDEHR